MTRPMSSDPVLGDPQTSSQLPATLSIVHVDCLEIPRDWFEKHRIKLPAVPRVLHWFTQLVGILLGLETAPSSDLIDMSDM